MRDAEYQFGRVPEGYVIGLVRDPLPENRKVAHLYKGTFNDPGDPMCSRGWNRDDGASYSIWRGQVGEVGICLVCRRRAKSGLPPVPSRLRD